MAIRNYGEPMGVLQPGNYEVPQLTGGKARWQIPQNTNKNPAVTAAPVAQAPATNAPDPSVYDFRATPGYDWRMEQGRIARENALVSRGLGLSGRALKEMERYGQDYGTGEYQNVFNRRASIAGVTQPMTQQMNQAGMNYAGNVGNALMQGGAAQASAYMNQGQSWNNAIQGGLQNYMFYNAFGGGG